MIYHRVLSTALDATVKTCSEARYAGAIGAARIAVVLRNAGKGCMLCARSYEHRGF